MRFSIAAIAAACCVSALSSPSLTMDPSVEASLISAGFYPGMDPAMFTTRTTESPQATTVVTGSDVDAQTNSLRTVTKSAAGEPAVIPGQTKRDNPIYFNLQCSGDNMSAAPRKCNNKALNGDWCSNNCECTWTGCMKCKKLDGCSAAVVSATCAAVISAWDCRCVGFGPKDGQEVKCGTS